jgi:hypothetical protein
MPTTLDTLRTRATWKALGYSVPTKAKPTKVQEYLVPGYRSTYRERHLFSFDQVKPVATEVAAKRATAAAKGVSTRIKNMEYAIETAELTIVRGKTNAEIISLARSTHGGNYQGRVGEFHWSNRAAHNAIRHALTNYEQQWEKINRGPTAEFAYYTLRERIDELVDEAYPQFSLGMPEVPEFSKPVDPAARPSVH